MDEKEMMAVIEAILFVAGDPVSVKDISELLNIDVTETEKLMDNMRAGFESQKRGLQIIKVEDTYQLVTRPEFMDYIRQFTGINKEQSLSRACLETLTIIAYKQPVTKADIEQLRGVKCDYSIAVLMERNLIQEAGRLNAPGRPKLYCTTHTFLKSFGLSSIQDLPPLDNEETA
ncbi:MAG: SMC-Scp complex subunit ScpB [Clostridiales bacterium]|jgi:segregation and condensation protein B|nr:SMC-Scp complex subunit ScpB [Clostridiales bacterium]